MIKVYIDPPSGWRQGFPKEVPAKYLDGDKIKDGISLIGICIELGYGVTSDALSETFVRVFTTHELVLNEQQEKLFDFVKELHGDQKRKYTEEPYYEHPFAVAQLLDEYNIGLDYPGYSVEVALCHDLLEDTECTSSRLFQILDECGYGKLTQFGIVRKVGMLTNRYIKKEYPEWNREKRKRREAESFAMKPSLVCSIKCADLIENSRSIILHDEKFAKVYMKEIFYMIPFLKKSHHKLFRELNSILYNYYTNV